MLMGSDKGGLVHEDDIEGLRITLGRTVEIPGKIGRVCNASPTPGWNVALARRTSHKLA